jgi:electron transfer flavoprotein beta subunit
MLTDAAAVGVDSLLHILVEDISGLDSTQVQSILAAAVAHSGSDIVFCGKQAADTNAGSTGPGVAHLMDASCVTMVSEVVSDGSSLTAMRASSDGNERVAVSAPCVFAFDKGIIELRRPNVRGIMMAKKKVAETLSPADLGVDISVSSVSIIGHNPPPQKPPGQKFEGADSVAAVVGKLRDEANVI